MKRKALREPTSEEWDREIARIRSWRTVDVHGAPPSDPRTFEHWKRVRENVGAAIDLDRDLLSAGLPVGLSDLSQARLPYPKAIPVLLRHLQREYPKSIELAIIQALTVPYAGNDAFGALLRLLEERYDGASEHWRLSVGNALAMIADESKIANLSHIAENRKFEEARWFPILKLGKLGRKRPEIVPILVQIAKEDDPAAGHALHALRLAKALHHQEVATDLLQSTNQFTRTEATKYLKSAIK